MVTSVGYAVGGRSWTNERAAVREADRIMVRYNKVENNDAERSMGRGPKNFRVTEFDKRNGKTAKRESGSWIRNPRHIGHIFN